MIEAASADIRRAIKACRLVATDAMRVREIGPPGTRPWDDKQKSALYQAADRAGRALVELRALLKGQPSG